MVIERIGHPRTLLSEGTVAGCDLTLTAADLADGGAPHYLLSLDRDPHTYTRSLTAAELAALARLNPDDPVLAEARSIVADIAAIATVFVGDWEGLALYRQGKFVPNMLLRPIGTDGQIEIGRVAAALVAALDGGRP